MTGDGTPGRLHADITGVERIATARMLLERMRPQDHDELAVLLRDPLISSTLWPGEGEPSEAQLLHILDDKLRHWDRCGFGLWVLRDRATGLVVGRGGLQHTQVGEGDEVEAGWAIAPARWGEGLATELANACTAVAFGQLGFAQIVAFTLPANRASRRVMEKSGFAYERDVTHKGLVHVLYRASSRR
jgi:RimJ/RimL family protein N-acetyltransferase